MLVYHHMSLFILYQNVVMPWLRYGFEILVEFVNPLIDLASNSDGLDSNGLVGNIPYITTGVISVTLLGVVKMKTI